MVGSFISFEDLLLVAIIQVKSADSSSLVLLLNHIDVAIFDCLKVWMVCRRQGRK